MNARTATCAQPMPAGGFRSLTGPEAQRRAKGMACLREKGSECQGQVHVNIFFDGTGNNRNWAGTYVQGKSRSKQTQRERNGHSNVARLYDARLEEESSGIFNHYIPGVGTPFSDIGDSSQEGDMLGGAAAKYGAERINWAILQVFNSVHQYVTGNQLIPHDQMEMAGKALFIHAPVESVIRKAKLGRRAAQLEEVVKGGPRRVKSVHISVFGFSRGAAQARAFLHRMYEFTDAWGSGCGHSIAGVPLYVNFLGIFDTVASVGLASMSKVSDGKWSWASGELMSIHPEAKQSMHFAALHEQRINFPLDLATSGQERLYPGMHSDVGGGYSPGGQGKDFVNGKADGTAKLSQIPLVDMHHEAIKAGVLLKTIEEIRREPLLGMHFGCHPQLIRDYNAWLEGHAVGAGAHAKQIRKHSQQYVAWKGKRFWKGPDNLKQQPFYKQCDAEDLYDLNNAHRDFSQLVAKLAQDRKEWLAHQATLKRIETARRTGQLIFESTPHPSMAANNYARLPTETRNLAELVLDRTPVPEASTVLFDNYVHDSLAGFYLYTWTELNFPKLKTVGYLRYRSVFSVAGIRPQECRDPATLPRGNVPSVGGAFQQLGNTMGR
ncbi:phospholipase effector Tle1 domain-containing protein [Pseudomonas veronii]